MPLFWSTVAPARPAGDASDPDNPSYRWQQLDTQLEKARSHGLTPLVVIAGAPGWARQAPDRPKTPLGWNVPAFAAFTEAAVARYDGRHGHGRVSLWQAWNEPNGSRDLAPAFEHGQPVSPLVYRALVEAMSDAVHSSSSSNTMIAGGLSPFGRTGSVIAPLRFLRQLVCLDKDVARPLDCSKPLDVDVWAVHPYTSGGPFHSAYHPDDVSLGDLPEVRTLLRRVSTGGAFRALPRLWVTEFAWDSAPADPGGVPARRHARWLSAALFQMHRSGVELVSWFSLHDDPPSRSPYQSGLFDRNWRAKPALRSLRFPFYAHTESGRTAIWGRTPSSRPGRVRVERRSDGRWQPLTTLQANRFGVFQASIPAAKATALRARHAGEISSSFDPAPVRDQPAQPFGSR